MVPGERKEKKGEGGGVRCLHSHIQMLQLEKDVEGLQKQVKPAAVARSRWWFGGSIGSKEVSK